MLISTPQLLDCELGMQCKSGVVVGLTIILILLRDGGSHTLLRDRSPPVRVPRNINLVAMKIFAFAVILMLTPSFAQDNDPFSNPAPPEPRKFDIEFVNPTVESVCAYLTEELSTPDAPLNIVVSPEAAGIKLPTMKLRQVTLDQFLGFMHSVGHRETGDEQFTFSSVDEIYYVFAAPGKPKEGEERLTEVLHLGQESEAVLGLIEEALRITRRDYEPVLRFHEPSQSLLVTANKTDLRLIMNVVSQMEKRREYNTVQEAMMELETVQKELVEVQNANKFLEAMNAQLQAKIEQGQPSAASQVAAPKEHR